MRLEKNYVRNLTCNIRIVLSLVTRYTRYVKSLGIHLSRNGEIGDDLEDVSVDGIMLLK
jgi:hypothetical protein